MLSAGFSKRLAHAGLSGNEAAAHRELGHEGRCWTTTRTNLSFPLLIAMPALRSIAMVTQSKGSPGGDDQPETAQQTYHRMLRDWMAPALRQMGFKGSGQRFSLPHDTYECRFWFQKSVWSTPQMVSFSARFDVLHRRTFEAFGEALREADTEHGVRLSSPSRYVRSEP